VLPVLAEVVRSGVVESRHHGSLVALGPAGDVALAIGDVTSAIFPRSANKPLQTVGLLEAGLAETPGYRAEFLAIAAASHSGEPRHVAVVRDLLVSAGLTEADLDNVPGLPLDEAAAWALLRAGGAPAPIYQNCSGKHAAMLATAVAAGRPTSGYRDPAHPVQQAVRAAIERLAGVAAGPPAMDGCGAPLYRLSLTALARAFAGLATAAVESAPGRVAAAMRAHPELVGGSGRVVTELIRELPGLVAKDGAEGVFAAALPGGASVAVKIEDGANRAAAPALVAGLRAIGASGAVLDRLATAPVLGHGDVVGEIRCVLS